MQQKPRYIAVIGPTASGKSALAIRLAQALAGELINCDSVQFYRGFDIGSAKPDAAEQALVPHHLWDLLEPHQEFDAREFAVRAESVVQEVLARGKRPLLVGGTGLYLRALWQEKWHDLPKSEPLRAELSQLSIEDLRTRLEAKDPERARAIHPNDRFRLQRALEISTLLGHPIHELPPAAGRRHEAFVIRVQCERSLLHERIAKRTEQMLQSGFIEEVEDLLKAGVSPSAKPMQSIGYREVCAFLQGDLAREQLAEAIIIATRQYAKRQETWFRSVEENVVWHEGCDWLSWLEEIRRVFG